MNASFITGKSALIASYFFFILWGEVDECLIFMTSLRTKTELKINQFVHLLLF